MILIYVICRNKAEAKRIARMLLKLKLIACANWWDIESGYRWEGKIAGAKETAMILKTRPQYFKKVEGLIKKIHGYEIPCIVRLKPESVNSEYRQWLFKETKLV